MEIPSDSQHQTDGPDGSTDFYSVENALERRQRGLELAQKMFADDPTDSNRALVAQMELEVAEHTPLDMPIEPPGSE
jgi:hypothetical protein